MVDYWCTVVEWKSIIHISNKAKKNITKIFEWICLYVLNQNCTSNHYFQILHRYVQCQFFSSSKSTCGLSLKLAPTSSWKTYLTSFWLKFRAVCTLTEQTSFFSIVSQTRSVWLHNIMVVKTNLPVWQMWFYCKECGYVSFSFFPPLPSVIAFGGR